MVLRFGGPGQSPVNKLGFGNRISLAAGETWIITPAGSYWVRPGLYTFLQVWDPIVQTWFTLGGSSPGEPIYIEADGVNYRLANLTGLPVGGLITNVGSGYTSNPAVTISAGNSIWRTVVGGSVATPTVANAGSGYTYPPVVTFAPPPTGGVPATGVAVLSGGALSSITMINVGAGYTSAPVISITNDPREGQNSVTAGVGAAAVTTLTNSGKVTALICVDPGNTQYTSASVPTFTISGGGGSSFAATAIMCWTMTSFTVTGGTGVGGSGANSAFVSAVDTLGLVTITAASTNPEIQQNLVRVRQAAAIMPVSGGVPTATGEVIQDGGIYTTAATPLVTTANGATTTGTTVAPTFAGVSDTSYIAS